MLPGHKFIQSDKLNVFSRDKIYTQVWVKKCRTGGYLTLDSPEPGLMPLIFCGLITINKIRKNIYTDFIHYWQADHTNNLVSRLESLNLTTADATYLVIDALKSEIRMIHPKTYDFIKTDVPPFHLTVHKYDLVYLDRRDNLIYSEEQSCFTPLMQCLITLPARGGRIDTNIYTDFNNYWLPVYQENIPYLTIRDAEYISKLYMMKYGNRILI